MAQLPNLSLWHRRSVEAFQQSNPPQIKLMGPPEPNFFTSVLYARTVRLKVANLVQRLKTAA